MSVVEDRSYERWLHAYGDVWATLPGDLHLPCPRCGADALRLVFAGDETERVAYAAFWCDNCLHGIHVSRADVPAGARIRPFTQSDDQQGLPFRAGARYPVCQVTRWRRASPVVMNSRVASRTSSMGPQRSPGMESQASQRWPSRFNRSLSLDARVALQSRAFQAMFVL